MLQDMLNRTKEGRDLMWFKNLKSYYQRPEFELFDLKYDANEEYNVAGKPAYKASCDLCKCYGK